MCTAHHPKSHANFCVCLCFSGEGSLEFLRFLKGFMIKIREEPMSQVSFGTNNGIRIIYIGPHPQHMCLACSWGSPGLPILSSPPREGGRDCPGPSAQMVKLRAPQGRSLAQGQTGVLILRCSGEAAVCCLGVAPHPPASMELLGHPQGNPGSEQEGNVCSLGSDLRGQILGSHCLAGSPWPNPCPSLCLGLPFCKREGL